MKRGDSLWRISQQYGVTVDEILAANNISNPRELKVGQLVVIPAKKRLSPQTVSLPKSSGMFAWPIKGEVISSFGEKNGTIVNRGVNIKADDQEYVKASAAGKILFVEYLQGWGETLVVEHRGSFHTIYANLADVRVKETQTIQQGELLARVAQDNRGERVLHFEIRKQSVAKNPLNYLKKY